MKEINSSIVTVLGGPHCTCLPESVAGYDSVDYVVVGEGEETIQELALKIQNREPVDSVKGLAYKVDGKVHRTPPRPFIEDLDSLPFPAKDLILNREWMHTDHYCNIFATRGCPYQCTFCSSQSVWSRKVRYRSPENVVAEMKEMQRLYNSEFFSFADDSFTVNKK